MMALGPYTSRPRAPYFDSGLPYGRDQFISAATNWATVALARTAGAQRSDRIQRYGYSLGLRQGSDLLVRLRRFLQCTVAAVSKGLANRVAEG